MEEQASDTYKVCLKVEGINAPCEALVNRYDNRDYKDHVRFFAEHVGHQMDSNFLVKCNLPTGEQIYINPHYVIAIFGEEG